MPPPSFRLDARKRLPADALRRFIIHPRARARRNREEPNANGTKRDRGNPGRWAISAVAVSTVIHPSLSGRAAPHLHAERWKFCVSYMHLHSTSGGVFTLRPSTDGDAGTQMVRNIVRVRRARSPPYDQKDRHRIVRRVAPAEETNFVD